MTFVTVVEADDERLLTKGSAVVRHRDAQLTLSGVRCGGCGREVVQLDWAEAQLLISAEHDKPRSLRAYECAWCEVVLFEDEMIDGQFVPAFEALPSTASSDGFSEYLK